jgi:hypothetical protein
MRRATIERERRRIEAAFCAALLAASAVAIVEACGSNGDGSSASPDASAGDGGGDSGGGETSEPIDGALTDAGGDGAPAADVLNCAPTFFILDGATLADLDAGADADLCDLVEPCGMPQGLATQGCLVIEAELDGSPIADSGFGCNIAVGHGCVNGAYVQPPGPGVEFTCTCDLFIQGGRRTGRVRPGRGGDRGSLGGFFAAMAREERASIAAFDRLATELASHGAPAHLVRAAARARGDEARHAATMARLARRHGGVVGGEEKGSACSVRALEAIARENAVEGCVRETFAALLARWQAGHADDDTIRAAFARIARDEARHAALAWAVAAWVDGRLDSGARRRVARARGDATRAVARSLRGEVDGAIARGAGVPRPREARALFAEMTRALGA